MVTWAYLLLVLGAILCFVVAPLIRVRFGEEFVGRACLVVIAGVLIAFFGWTHMWQKDPMKEAKAAISQQVDNAHLSLVPESIRLDMNTKVGSATVKIPAHLHTVRLRIWWDDKTQQWRIGCNTKAPLDNVTELHRLKQDGHC